MFHLRIHHLLILMIGALLMIGFSVDTAQAQAFCTSPYTVQRGDSLSEISRRCNVTLANLIAANPAINNPARIFVGQQLTIPGATAEQPLVTITPTSGEPGTPVRLEARNFPPNTDVTIAAGPQASEFDPIAASRTNYLGSIIATVNVPTYADSGESWVFVVETIDDTASTTSNAFAVQPDVSPPTACGDTYTVAYRDTLARIARECNVSLRDLISTNPQIVNPALIYTGQQINIPGSDGSGDGNLFTSAQIYMIDVASGGQSGIPVGCNDSAVPVTVRFDATVAPLTAALENLLNLNSRLYGQTSLYNPLYQSNLSLNGISINDGTATISLSGSLVSAGACDDPRIRAQIEQTALHYSTIDRVDILVNGVPLEDILA